jgi:L-malate glycosyltransferase
MNVLILTSWSSRRDRPYLGVYFIEQAKAISKYVMNIVLIDIRIIPINEINCKTVGRIVQRKENGIVIYSIDFPSIGFGRIPFLYQNLYNILFYFLYLKVKKIYKIDLVHAHSFYPAGAAAVFWSRYTGIPIIYTEHASSVLSRSISEKLTDRLKQVHAISKSTLCVSKALGQSIKYLTGSDKPIIVISNGIDDAFFKGITNPQFSTINFISVGNLVAIKRYDLLIEAFGKVVSKYPNVSLRILGEGGERKKLEEVIIEKKLEEYVKLMGAKTRIEVLSELRESDVFVLSSDYETNNVACLEALAVGLPVISTKSGGPEDYISESNGVLVDKGDANELSGAMLRMIRDYKNYSANSIREYTYNHYSYPAIARQIVHIYSNAIK